jgi:hypothetical protein
MDGMDRGVMEGGFIGNGLGTVRMELFMRVD